MKKVSPIIALLLVFTLLFSTVAMAAEDAQIEPSDAIVQNIVEEAEDEAVPVEAIATTENSNKKQVPALVQKFYDDGVPVLTTNKFFRVVDAIRMVKYIFTGKIIAKKPSDFEVTVDENLSVLLKDVSDKSGLDVEQIITNLPDDILEPGKVATKVFHIDTKEYREEMFALRDQYIAEGQSTKANICWLVGVYMGGLTKADVVMEPMKDKDYYRIKLVVTYADGGQESLYPNIYIDLNTGDCFGLDDKGMLSTGFNSNIYEGMVYAPINCWMRNFGFCIEYDLLCYALPSFMYNYRTRRFHFNYNNKQYMIQCWKGNYLITTGGEVGVYYRDMNKIGTYYDVVKEEDQMDMSLQILHNDDVLVNIPEQNHWWVNGFKLCPVSYSPHSLTMIFTIVFPDEEMRDAFTKSVERNIWHDVTYTTDGLKVTVEWDG